MEDKIKKTVVILWESVSVLILSYALYLHIYWIGYWPAAKWWGWEWDFFWILSYFCAISFIIFISSLYFKKDRASSNRK